MAREDDTGYAGTLGAPQERPQVPRVGQSSSHQQKRLRAFGGGPAEVLELHRLNRIGVRQHTLIRFGAGLGIEPGSGHRLDGDAEAEPPVPQCDRAAGKVPDLRPATPGGPCVDRPSKVRAPPDALRPDPRQVRSPSFRRRVWPLRARRRTGWPSSRRWALPHVSSSRTIAMQAMPSARPSAPNPSARVALTETGAPRTGERRSTMASV